MNWLIIIIVVAVIGYFVLRGIAANDEIKKTKWREDCLDNSKAKIIKYLTISITELKAGNYVIFISKKEITEKIAEWQGEIEIVRLWDKHYKTIMVSDKYNREAKILLENAWFDYLMAYDQLVSELDVGIGDSFEAVKVLRETRETLIAKLEAFGYDGDKEYKDIEIKLKPRPNKARKVN
jgi:hypothetical protein